MTKLQKAKTGRYFITLPRLLVERKKWNKGQNLYLTFNEKGNIEIIE